MSALKILFIGDVVGQAGRRLVRERLPGLRAERELDVVIANGENAVGRGITPATADELFAAGVDVITLGNHTWDRRELTEYLDLQRHIIRPYNYPDHYEAVPGRGWTVFQTPAGPVAVINLIGRVFLPMHADSPFYGADQSLSAVARQAKVIFVDFHAEATSEKQALGWHLDGRATALVGTHTHVQTADERVLPGGTAYITDAGMTGPINSVIGAGIRPILQRFRTQRPSRYEEADGPRVFSGVVITADTESGHAQSIERVFEVEKT
ncbi:MAG: TIGR00282 family metallophosphoesterase [Thermaerobacterales bacterium]